MDGRPPRVRICSPQLGDAFNVAVMTPFENFCVGLLDPTVAGGGHAWVLTFVIYAPEDTPRYQRNSIPYGYNTLKQYYTANPHTGLRTPHNVDVPMLPSGLGYIKVPTHIGKIVITQDQDWSNKRLRVSDIVERGGEIEQIVQPNALIDPDIKTRLAVVDQQSMMMNNESRGVSKSWELLTEAKAAQTDRDGERFGIYDLQVLAA
ncbi:hypothetical protein L1887_51425 [Cichorium endivia]|nr:hypothetical protein L1887_51425 [Cichorium endivia]